MILSRDRKTRNITLKQFVFHRIAKEDLLSSVWPFYYFLYDYYNFVNYTYFLILVSFSLDY